MSLVAQYHAAHKARLMRMGSYQPPQPKPVAPVYEPKPLYIFAPEFYYRNMWFWDLVTFAPKGDVVMRPTFHKIVMIVAKDYGITFQQMMSHRRTKDIVIPRQVAAYLCRELTVRSLPEIGRFFGGRDHTTILHSCNRVEEYAKNPEMEAVLERLTSEILAP